MAELTIVDVQSAYEQTPVGTVHVLLDTTQGSWQIQQDAAAAVTNIVELIDDAGVVQHSWQNDSLTLGLAVSDIFSSSLTGVNVTPTLFPTRPTLNFGLDVLALLPTSRTFTTTVNKITFGSGATFTLDFVNATAAAALIVNPTVTFNQDGNGFGSGLVVNHSATYQGDVGSTRFIGPIFTFVHQPTLRANGAGSIVTHSQGRDFLSQPIFTVTGGATSYTMTGTWTQLFCSGQVRTNATVTMRRIVYCGMLANATGTVTDTTAVEIDNLTPQTVNPAMGIENNIAAPGIQYQGSTGLFGIFSATPVAQAAAYTPTNVSTDRSYNANATTLDEIADVLGTLIADLQAYGWLG